MAKVLITGTSSGIGLATALHFARQGHQVVAGARNPEGARDLQDAIASGLPITSVRIDVDDDASVREGAGACGDLDVLVNNSSNFKSKIIEWAQREGREIKFEIISIKKGKNHKEFTAQVTVDSEPKGTGYGNSKKKAEQDAAFKTCEMLSILTIE